MFRLADRSTEQSTFTFDTGVLRGLLRQEGRSIGLVPVTYTADDSEIAGGEDLFNHYRVCTCGRLIAFISHQSR
jgi:hypothetical protein